MNVDGPMLGMYPSLPLKEADNYFKNCFRQQSTSKPTVLKETQYVSADTNTNWLNEVINGEGPNAVPEAAVSFETPIQEESASDVFESFIQPSLPFQGLLDFTPSL